MTALSRDLSWTPDYRTVLASKVYFLADVKNLQESFWARGRIVLADFMVRNCFTEFCRRYPSPELYADFATAVGRVTHFSYDEIAELGATSRYFILLTGSSPPFGCGAENSKHPRILGMLDYVAVAVGSAFNAGYYGIRLCRVVGDCSTVSGHEIARFYGGRIYENRSELELLRNKGIDV